MGIDLHALNFLRHVRKKQPLGDTVTIGRQSLHIVEPVVRKLVSASPSYKNQPYCEDLLVQYLGASKVESVDNSAYEGATYVHNMNEPLPQTLWAKFDTIFDCGSSEHIFNVPQALRNYSLLAKPGGQILHLLPANNFCGHGFWQFSPELFFSLYSESNGYTQTEVYLADLSNTSRWFQVKEPKDGKRINVLSSTAMYVLVRTVLQASDFSHTDIQQSDYKHMWNDAKEEITAAGEMSQASKPGLKKRLKEVPFIYNLLSPAHQLLLRAKRRSAQRKSRLDENNPGLTKIQIRSST